MKVYGDTRSGNCLKVKFTADYLGLPYEWVDVDILQGESRTPEFLARSAQGQVPVVEFDDGRCLAQSNAVIRYLARDSALLPADPFLSAKVDEYLFWEQYSHEPYIAVCRFHMQYRNQPRETREAWRVERGEQALDFMERQIAGRDWFVGAGPSVADVALVAYTRWADEGGFDLATRPAVRSWVARCEAELAIT